MLMVSIQAGKHVKSCEEKKGTFMRYSVVIKAAEPLSVLGRLLLQIVTEKKKAATLSTNFMMTL